MSFASALQLPFHHLFQTSTPCLSIARCSSFAIRLPSLFVGVLYLCGGGGQVGELRKASPFFSKLRLCFIRLPKQSLEHRPVFFIILKAVNV